MTNLVLATGPTRLSPVHKAAPLGGIPFAVSQANSETFAFSPGFVAASISGLQIGGAGSDAIQFDVSMFNGLSSTNTSAQDFAKLLASGAAVQSGQNVAFTDSAGEALTLKNVTTSMLSAAANSLLKFV